MFRKSSGFTKKNMSLNSPLLVSPTHPNGSMMACQTQNLKGLPNMIVYATLLGSMESPFV